MIIIQSIVILLAIFGEPLFVVIGITACLGFLQIGSDPAIVYTDFFRISTAPAMVAIPFFIFACL